MSLKFVSRKIWHNCQWASRNLTAFFRKHVHIFGSFRLSTKWSFRLVFLCLFTLRVLIFISFGFFQFPFARRGFEILWVSRDRLCDAKRCCRKRRTAASKKNCLKFKGVLFSCFQWYICSFKFSAVATSKEKCLIGAHDRIRHTFFRTAHISLCRVEWKEST